MIDIVKIVLVVALSVYASVSDCIKGIIKNKVLIPFFVVGIFLNVVEWFCFDAEYLFMHFLNIAIVVFISMALYTVRVWAGGDAKFVVTLSFLVPYNLYFSTFSNNFSLILVLVFAFALSYIFLIAESIYKGIKNKHVASKDKIVKQIRKILFRMISCSAYLMLFDNILLLAVPNIQQNSSYLIVAINICLVLIINGIKVLRNKYLLTVVIAANIIICIILRLQILNKFTLINLVVVVVINILKALIDEYNYEIIPTQNVKKGMILSAETTLLFLNSRVNGLPKMSTEDLRSRLSESEAESVKRWENLKYGVSEIRIVRKIPFAVFVSLGTLIFMILGALNDYKII